MDDIVEDARRETEVLLSIRENQNHGRGHDYGYNSSNIFVLLTRLVSSLSGDLERWVGEDLGCGNDTKKLWAYDGRKATFS